jgi:hypothetical protein
MSFVTFGEAMLGHMIGAQPPLFVRAPTSLCGVRQHLK